MKRIFIERQRVTIEPIESCEFQFRMVPKSHQSVREGSTIHKIWLLFHKITNKSGPGIFEEFLEYLAGWRTWQIAQGEYPARHVRVDDMQSTA